jgi:hypothetical protein
MIEETGDGERREALKRERSRQPGQPQEPKQYALVVALWPAGEWAAAVVEDELGLRVVHRHNPGCSDGSCGVDTTRPGWTVAEAIELAEKKRDEMLAASLPYWGPPASIDTIIEPTGDAGRLEARVKAGPEAPRPPTPAPDPVPGGLAAAVLLAFMGLHAAARLPARVLGTIVGLAVLGAALVGLVALGWTVWQDREVIRCWRRVLAEAHEEQRERVTKWTRRLRGCR